MSTGLPRQTMAGHNYAVATHTVRITKQGYAVEPIQLKYPEITNKFSLDARRSSDLSFDATQTGYKILELIRGFWSQPAFPKGRLVAASTGGATGRRSKPDQSPSAALFWPGFGQATKQMSPLTDSPSSSGPAHSKKHIRSSLSSTSSSSSSSSASSKRKKGHEATYHNWIPKNKNSIAELIIELCQQVGQVFANESRVLKVSSPCFVLGDIHGNLTDLRAYERSLWPKAPICLPCNYLFLGDYVDRGEHSVECILYLLAMKLISPDRFYLLRGNHEVAAIQRQYTFGRECEAKFGLVGKELWRCFNRVFDMMPIVAIVDGQIYCAHGGIPRSVTDISRLADEIPTPLDNPEAQSAAAWEILWNDPITDAELVAMIEMDQTILGQTPPAPAPATTTTTTAPTTTTVPESVPSQAPQATSDTSASVGSTERSANPDTSTKTTGSTHKEDQITNTNNTTTTPTTTTVTTTTTTTSTSANTTTTTTTTASNDNNDTTLRKMPSDTSSIASNSPQQIFSDGFVGNIKRGTAFLFSDQAINNFLRVNKLSHVIRAHEVIPTGFAFHGDGRVITIFSSSKYCGLNNQATCILVDRDKIRIMRLDTSDDVGE